MFILQEFMSMNEFNVWQGGSIDPPKTLKLTTNYIPKILRSTLNFFERPTL